MRNLQEVSKRIAELVQLLSEMGGLEITADISFDEGVPSSNEVQVRVYFTGRDTPILTSDNGQVLDAIETISRDMLGLSATEQNSIRFDAGNFLAEQRIKLRQIARMAIKHVEFSGTPHVFPPMSYRDRSLLADALLPSGLYYETLGQSSTQWIILFPKEMSAQMETSEAQHLSSN